MKVLLDENIPVPVTSAVKTLLRRSHDVRHVIDLPGWSGTNAIIAMGFATRQTIRRSFGRSRPPEVAYSASIAAE